MDIEFTKPEVRGAVLSFESDRRRGERFPMTLNLRFRHVLKKEDWTNSGSVNFSHSGIQFKADRPTHVGAAVELIVDWPSTRGNVLKRELVLAGKVVPVRDGEVTLFSFWDCQRKP